MMQSNKGLTAGYDTLRQETTLNKDPSPSKKKKQTTKLALIPWRGA